MSAILRPYQAYIAAEFERLVAVARSDTPEHDPALRALGITDLHPPTPPQPNQTVM